MHQVPLSSSPLWIPADKQKFNSTQISQPKRRKPFLSSGCERNTVFIWTSLIFTHELSFFCSIRKFSQFHGRTSECLCYFCLCLIKSHEQELITSSKRCTWKRFETGGDVLTIPQCDRIQREELWQVLFSLEQTLHGNSDLGQQPSGFPLWFTQDCGGSVWKI